VIATCLSLAAFRVFRIAALSEERFQKLVVTTFPAGTDGVVAGVVFPAGFSEIGSAVALHQEEADRSPDRVGSTRAFLEEGATWEWEQFLWASLGKGGSEE
jgi:hypothetical protein